MKKLLYSAITEMKSTKLIELLKAFKEKEFLSLENFIASPYFNKNENVVTLFSTLKKYYPDFENEELDKEKIFVKVFGKKKYDDEKMRTLISALMKLIKKYLVQLELEQRKWEADIFLLAQLSKKNQEILFEYEHKKAEAYVEENLYRERDYYFAKFSQATEYFFSKHSGIKDKKKETEIIESLASNFERFMFFEIMDTNYQMLTRKMRMNYQPKYLLLDYFKKRIESGEYSDTPLLLLKYYGFLCIEDKDKEEYFEKYQRLFLENFDKISGFERSSIILGLLNYCTLAIVREKRAYAEKSFELYKFALEKNLFFHSNKFFLPLLFFNIVKCSLFLGEQKWCFNFIFNYRSKIAPHLRKNEVNISFAAYYVERKEYEEALKHINKVNPVTDILKLEVRRVSSQIFYGLDYVENVYSTVDSIKYFLKNRNTLANHITESAKRYVKYMPRLIELKQMPDKYELGYLKKEILEDKQIGMQMQKWFKERIEELLKK